MFTRKVRFQAICLAMAIVTFWSWSPGHQAFAALIATQSGMSRSDASSARAQLIAFVAREDVTAALLQHGITRAEAEARVRALNDDEVALVAQQLPELPAAGDMGMSGAWIVLMVVVMVAVVAALIMFGVWAVNQSNRS